MKKLLILLCGIVAGCSSGSTGTPDKSETDIGNSLPAVVITQQPTPNLLSQSAQTTFTFGVTVDPVPDGSGVVEVFITSVPNLVNIPGVCHIVYVNKVITQQLCSADGLIGMASMPGQTQLNFNATEFPSDGSTPISYATVLSNTITVTN